MTKASIIEKRRLSSPTITPQALAWDGEQLWMSSRDLGTLCKIDSEKWRVVGEVDPPGVVWAGVFTNNGWRFTIGKGLNDDRYVYRYAPDEGFTKLFACPDLTGSYLGFDGKHLYLSQWYKGLILQVDDAGNASREIEVGKEICGHTFADGTLYVLRGTEQDGERWSIARVSFNGSNDKVDDLATVPFAARSLTFDGERFWSNHRAANETISSTVD